MASTMRILVALVVFVPLVSALDVTPIGKVVQLLEDLRTETQTDARTEAALYDTFATACRDQTAAKSQSITDASQEIGLESGYLADKSTDRQDEIDALTENKALKETDQRTLDADIARCKKMVADYNEADRTLTSSIAGLKRSFETITASMPSLLQSDQSSFKISPDLKKTVDMAVAMGMVVLPEHKAVASLIQQDGLGDEIVNTNDRTYGFHSDDINALFKSIHGQFEEQKTRADDQEVINEAACTGMKHSLEGSIELHGDNILANGREIAKLEGEMGVHRSTVVAEKNDLKEFELYLKDLTAECEARAKDWDQRTKMAADEVAAISSALAVLTGEDGVQQAADQVNKRAMLITAAKPKVALAKVEPEPSAPAAKSAISKDDVKAAIKKDDEDFDEDELDVAATHKPISLLQLIQAKSFLASRSATEAVRKDKALALLSNEGQRLKSLTLINLAQSTAADPFAKVKGLLETLTMRLKAEAANEATKQMFCDGELAKAKKERDYRFSEGQELTAVISGLHAKRDSLADDLEAVNATRTAAGIALTNGTDLRGQEKIANAATITKAQEGVVALKTAVQTLQEFYTNAAKASFLQASPIDGQLDAGFSGSSKGHQSGTKAIMALLATIGSDFDRTIRNTEGSEAKAVRDWHRASDNLKVEIAHSDTKFKLTQQDLKSTKVAIDTKTEELQTSFNLLDESLRVFATLQPTCIDTGMHYQERTEKREQEVAALESALLTLAAPP